MNFSDGELSIYFIWLLVWQRGCNSTWYKSTVVLKWLFKRREKNTENEWSWGWSVLLCFFSLSAVNQWSTHTQPSKQHKPCNWVWACPLSPLFDSKGWTGEKRGKKCSHMCAAPFHLHRWWVRSLRKGLCILSRHNFTATWSYDGLILLKWWCTSWETVGV